jgi:release factor glutamine methyltransferase
MQVAGSNLEPATCNLSTNMQTVAAARAWAIPELRRARLTSPTLSADLLLGFVLGWDRVRVLSHTEDVISGEAWMRFQDLILRNAQGEPLQYLTGVQEFFGLAFHVKPGVLIPRPETEILVEKAIHLIRDRSPSRARFLDVGTGSGCVAIAVAHAVPSANGWAVDISAEALEIARGNAARHHVAERICLIRSNLLDCFPRNPCFDLVLCNPPYVALKDYDSLPSEVRDHEPHLALFGGETGMELYRELIPEIPPRLTVGGYLLLEMGAGQTEETRQRVENAGLFVETILPDLQGIPRCLVGRRLPGVIDG